MTATMDRTDDETPTLATASTTTPRVPLGETDATRPAELTDAELDAFGAAMDEIRAEILANRGEADAAYIHRVIALQRRLEAAGRLALFAGVLPPFWVAGTAMLATAKILENMEIGHNVMHGQWDWMQRPGHQLDLLGLGQRLPHPRPVEALAQLRPPHLHQHPRQGP